MFIKAGVSYVFVVDLAITLDIQVLVAVCDTAILSYG